jgi:hypothetical protein
MKVYLDTAKNAAFLETNHLLSNNIFCKIRFIDFRVNQKKTRKQTKK